MSVKPQYTYPKKIVIGTRGSPLALWQANKVKSEIVNIGQNIEATIRIINTSGDWCPSDGERRLDALEGGKAQFAKEIEEALLAGKIDIAVHSMKDMETILPEGLVIPFMLPRADCRDAFLSNSSQNIDDLPSGCVVGTASVRRQAFLLNKRPDLKVVPFRGNVETRISKLREGQVEATFLAVAGLSRLGLMEEVSSVVDIDDMLPSVAQGAVGIEVRKDNINKLSFISQFSCLNTILCIECERAVLRELNGSCHTPIGVLAQLDNGNIYLRACVISPDGKDKWYREERGEVRSIDDAIALGIMVGNHLKQIVPADIISNKGQ